MSSSRSVRLVPVLLGMPCVAVVVAYGQLTGEALAAVGVTGTVLAAVGLVTRAGQAAEPVGRDGRPWLAWLAAAAAWELVTLVDDRLPTLSDLLDPVLSSPAARGAATVGWLAAGAWLLARPRPQDRSP